MLTVSSPKGFEESISSHTDSWHGGEMRREETEKEEKKGLGGGASRDS